MIDIFVLYGPPASGKGTISKNLPDEHCIGTGALLRSKNMGLTGDLITDDYVNQLITDELKTRKGYVVLDGYPRTEGQADYLLHLKGVRVRQVYELTCPDIELKERLSKRQTCHCGGTYHPTLKPSKKKGICDLCGQKLFRRKDDAPEIVEKRLLQYHQMTDPILAKFGKLVKKVDVSKDFKSVVLSIVDEIKKSQNKRPSLKKQTARQYE